MKIVSAIGASALLLLSMMLHRVASPFRPFRQIMIPGHAPIIAADLERFLLERSGPQLIHSFGVWGWVTKS